MSSKTVIDCVELIEKRFDHGNSFLINFFNDLRLKVNKISMKVLHLKHHSLKYCEL